MAMDLILGTMDSKPITGQQAKAVHKHSFLKRSGIFSDFGSEVSINADPIISNQLNIGSGLMLVDGTICENSLGGSIELINGTNKVYAEVNNLTQMSKIDKTTGNLIQEDLTLNPSGTYQYQLATVVVENNNITSIVKNATLLENNKKDEIFSISELEISNNTFAGLNSDQCFQVINSRAEKFGPCVVMDRITTGNFPNLRQALSNDPRFLINADFNFDPHFVMEIVGTNQSTGGFLRFGYDNSTKTQELKFDNDFVPGSGGYGSFLQMQYNNYLKGESLYKLLLWQGNANDGDTFNISAKFSDYPIIRFDFQFETYQGHADVYYVQGTEIARAVGTFAFELSDTTKIEILDLLVRFETESSVTINKVRGMNLYAEVDNVVKSDFRANFTVTKVYGMKN